MGEEANTSVVEADMVGKVAVITVSDVVSQFGTGVPWISCYEVGKGID